jgi:cyclic beta-1,2-glucan synthetase
VPTERGFERNRLPLISRFKILDNLRRSLVAPAMVALLTAAWTVLPGSPLGWTLAALAVPALPILEVFLAARRRQRAGVFLRTLAADLGTAAVRSLLTITFLAYHAWEMVHAILLTLVRLVVTQQRLLEWESAAVTAARATRLVGRGGLRVFLVELSAAPLFAGWLLLVVATTRPDALGAALPVLALWIGSPLVAYWLSRPVEPKPLDLSAADRSRMRRWARKTWRYFETFARPEDHGLPLDNYQEAPVPQHARRTSPTNLAMTLVATVAAHELGFIRKSELAARLEALLSTIEGLERFEGHLLNWYDTASLAPLHPRYVSTVDSGNLAGVLIALASALRRLAGEPEDDGRVCEGLAATAQLAADALGRLAGEQPSEQGRARALAAGVQAILALLAESADGADKLARLGKRARALRSEAGELDARPCSVRARRAMAWMRSSPRACTSWRGGWRAWSRA